MLDDTPSRVWVRTQKGEEGTCQAHVLRRLDGEEMELGSPIKDVRLRPKVKKQKHFQEGEFSTSSRNQHGSNEEDGRQDVDASPERDLVGHERRRDKNESASVGSKQLKVQGSSTSSLEEGSGLEGDVKSWYTSGDKEQDTSSGMGTGILFQSVSRVKRNAFDIIKVFPFS